MADDVLASFMVALGFKVDSASQNSATKSMADYEKAIKDTEARVTKVRADNAKAAIQIGALKELAQAREALEAAKAAAKIAEAEREKATAAERSTKRIADAERERAKAHGEATAFAIAKFALLIAAMQRAASAASGALTNTVADFNRLYYVSGRTGSSVASLKALGYAFEQTGSSAHDAISAVESFTQAMRTNPGAKQFVDNLGVDKNLGGVERLISAVDKLNERHAPYIAQQYATGILGLSVEQYNQFTLQGREMKRLLDQRREFAKSIGLDEEQGAQASKRFAQALGEISMMAETTFQRVLIDVMPRLTGWIEKARNWLKEHQGGIKEWIDWAEEKIRAFATAVEGYFKGSVANGFEDLFGEELGKKFDRFNERLTKLADALKVIAGFVRTLAPYAKELFGREVLSTGVNTAVSGTLNGLGGAGTVGAVPPVDNRTWYEKILPNALGGKPAPEGSRGGIFARARRARGGAGDGDAGRLNARAPEGPGRYRPQYSLSDADLDQRVINTIAGEVSTKNSEGVDAVINNMLNRVGSKGWGRSGNLLEVARAKGQYAGYREAGETESEFVRSRIRAIASGGVPDNTNGANSYRAESYYRGEGSGRTWAQTSKIGPNVAGNRYGFVSGIPNGPYAPYATPKDALAPASAIRGLPPGMTPGGFDPNNIMQPAPAGASPVTNNNSNSSKAVTQNITNNVKVDGASAPREQGRIIQSSLNAVHGLALANAQSAVA